jgi:hypothetical protein
LTAVVAALLVPAAPSAQTPRPVNAPPDVLLLQKSWRAETRNPSLDDDPFAANVEFNDAQRAQKMSELQNAIRARGSESREPPPQGRRKSDDKTKETQPLPVRVPERRVIYTYRAKVKNTGAKTIRLVHWGYAFLDPDTGQPLGLHHYSSKVRIRPGESADLAGRSASPQTSTVSAANAAKKLEEMIVIFRVEYDDGAIWQIPAK